jgi:hypothetical protein
MSGVKVTGPGQKQKLLKGEILLLKFAGFSHSLYSIACIFFSRCSVQKVPGIVSMNVSKSWVVLDI